MAAGSRFRAIIKGAMAAERTILREFPWEERYRVAGIEDVLTPALLLYPEIVASNIARTLHLLDGDANRWRPHFKTAKLMNTLRLLVEHGIRNFKCATTLELLVACRGGAALQARLGVDSKWVGVNRPGNYFYFELEPGPHYFCVEAVKMERGVLSLIVEKGKTYFLQQEITMTGTELEILDHDKGEHLVAK